MILEECPHCAHQVIFKVDGTCPGCGQSRFVLPQEKPNQTFDHLDDTDLEKRIQDSKRKGRLWLLAGALLGILNFFIVVLGAMSGTLDIVWYGGMLAAASLMGKGVSMLKAVREMKIVYNRRLGK